MNNKPTIAAFIILGISLFLAFLITASEQNSKIPQNDVEIFVVKQPIDVPKTLTTDAQLSNYKKVKNYLINKLKNKKRFLYAIVDSYEIEISDFWREILNHFEIFEYYKAYPEAFLRRLILMPTITGNTEFNEEVESEEKPIAYPDNDYRSIRYRVSLVPETIKKIKDIIDYFYNKIAIALSI